VTAYIVRRLLGLIPTLFIITIIGFIMMHLMPGNAFQALLFNPKIKNGASLLKNLQDQNGLNLSWPQQYVNWIGQMAHGNLGNSFEYNQPVSQLIGEYLPNTLELALAAEIIILIAGIPLGVFQASKVNGKFDISTSFFAIFLFSVPGFIFALFLMFIFSFMLNWLPSIGTVTPGVSWSGDLGDRLSHLILPALSLSLPAIAGYSRLTRGNTLSVIVQDYVRTARAKGLRQNKVLFRHVLRNSIIPIVTQFGFDIGGLFSGAVLIEEIFTWPGMGELSVNAVLNRDYPLILATLMIFAVAVLIGNLIADLFLAAADPRIRYS